MMRTARTGFTLIEVMIVLVILGVLAGIAMPKLRSTRRSAYEATMRSDLRNLVGAEELFFSDSSRYTGDYTQLSVRPSANTVITVETGPGFWTAKASHSQIADGFSCAISVNTQNPLVTQAPEGQPACAGAPGATGSRPGS